MSTPENGTTQAGLLQRIDHILFEPHSAIIGSRSRQKARYLSILLIIGIPIFIYAQTTSDITEVPLYYIVSGTYAIAYVLSRFRWYHLAAVLATCVSSFLPIGMFYFSTGYIPTDMPRITIWGTFAILVGALFLKPRYVIIQYSVIALSLLNISVIRFNLPVVETMEFFLTDALLAGLIIIFSFMINEYASKTEDQFIIMEKRRWELEVYTQLLRHDIRNDLHALLGSIELAELLVELNPENSKGQLSTSLKIGQSMVGLLDAFSSSANDVEMSLVTQIEQVAVDAQTVHPGLSINIASTKRAKEVLSGSSRLMPMVWMNIFRNSAQHAGPSPIIEVSVFDLQDSLKITIQDNGPGISEEKKPWIFIRGDPVESDNRGVGMYLARVIIESHGGQIALVDGDGCKFEIILPL